jgi:hypothetical protein
MRHGWARLSSDVLSGCGGRALGAGDAGVGCGLALGVAPGDSAPWRWPCMLTSRGCASPAVKPPGPPSQLVQTVGTRRRHRVPP